MFRENKNITKQMKQQKKTGAKQQKNDKQNTPPQKQPHQLPTTQKITNETTPKELPQHSPQNITQNNYENIAEQYPNFDNDEQPSNEEQFSNDNNNNNSKGIIIKSNEQIKKQVKRWKQINDTLQKKRQIEYELYKKKLDFEKQKQQKQKREKAESQQQVRRQSIKKRLEQIQLRKLKRNQVMEQEKRSRVAVSEEKRQPLYQEKEKQFQMKRLVEEAKIKEQIMRKKQEMMIDIEQLKQHEQKFINHLKQRFKSKNKTKKKSPQKNPNENQLGQSSNNEFTDDQPSLKNNKSEFIIYPNSDPIQKQKDLEKYLRRKKFEQKLRKIPIIIDEQKMKQALIAKDKAKNPLKYNYLSNVAALSDQKIYEEFKDFEININQKQLGNDYMKQIHEKIPFTSRIKSKSEAQLKLLPQLDQKQPYKNYMPDIKYLLKKKPQRLQPNDQVEQIMYRYESNSDRLAELNRKSDQYKNEVIKKITQIRNTSPTTAYTDYLGKEKQIDDLYMKSIKMKIATAKIA